MLVAPTSPTGQKAQVGMNGIAIRPVSGRLMRGWGGVGRKLVGQVRWWGQSQARQSANSADLEFSRCGEHNRVKELVGRWAVRTAGDMPHGAE